MQRRYGLSDEQMVWYVVTRAEKEQLHPGRGAAIMRQEHPSCLAGTERIGTEQGLLPIAEQSLAKMTALGAITGFYPKGEALVLRLRTSLGYELVATPEHEIATTDGAWVALERITDEDEVCLSAPQLADEPWTIRVQVFPSVVMEVRMTEAWGRFLGYFMGDGSFYEGALSIVCTGEDYDVIEDVCRLIQELLGVVPSMRPTGSKLGGTEIRCSAVWLKELFRWLGLLRHRGAQRSNGWKRRVHVPEGIWRSPRGVVREFLRGLFEADGFHDRDGGRIVLFSKYSEFLRDVQLLLLAFGITSRRKSSPKRSGDGHVYEGHELILRLEETAAFNERIGFISQRKRGRYHEPKMSEGSLRAGLKMSMSDRVTCVEFAGLSEVYDLGVQEAHAFSAGGILVHNCDTEAFLASGSVIFPPDILDPLQEDIREPVAGYRFERAGSWQWRLVACGRQEGALQVWEEPQTGYSYAIGVDVSSGTGSHESAIVVVRMPGFVQVAEWGDAHTSPEQLAGLVACVARYYAAGGGYATAPWVNVDITGGWGMATNNQLSETYSGEPLQLYIWETFDRVAPAKVSAASRTGWLFTWTSKNILISTALNVMRERVCQVPSESIQEDLRGITEETFGKRLTIGMSGQDRATAWLLAVVCAWRKIARWSWPMLGQEPSEAQAAPVTLDASRYDTTVDELTGPPRGGRGSTRGDRDVDWRIQW
jgi:intein/homing endonuclease